MDARCTPLGLPLLLIAAFAALSAAAASPCVFTYYGGGVFSSPGYPNNYANNTDCTYVLTSGGIGKVALKFNDFSLESNYDFLTITSDGVFVGRYSGSTKPPVLTLGNSVTLHFTSDLSIVAKGFSVSYRTLESNCGNLIVGSAQFRSPGYPVSYDAGLVCVWGLVATQGKTVTLDFRSFQLENGYDFLSIYDGDKFVARYTGSTLPPTASLGPAARLVFRSDASVGFSGINIVFLSEDLTCGGLITGEVNITSPNYPDNYPGNASCTWTYYVNSQILGLTFSAFDLERVYDIVKVYNGQDLLNTYTGNVRPSPIILTPGPVTVVFTSDVTIQHSGFCLNFFLWFDKK